MNEIREGLKTLINTVEIAISHSWDEGNEDKRLALFTLKGQLLEAYCDLTKKRK